MFPVNVCVQRAALQPEASMKDIFASTNIVVLLGFLYISQDLMFELRHRGHIAWKIIHARTVEGENELRKGFLQSR